LAKPPEEKLPIPDFRTVGSHGTRRPSAQLLETIYACQRRQDWYRDHAITNGEERLAFIDASGVADGVEEVAASIRQTVGLSAAVRSSATDAESALRSMFEQAEHAGILVMRNSVVGNNVWQSLSVDEFRGFALSDPYAPLVFINAADSKAAQMFTLAHELSHLWIGQSGVSNPQETMVSGASAVETFCNRVAAEALVPMETFRELWQGEADPEAEFHRLARRFRVSSLVIIRRAYDARFLTRADFEAAYNDEVKRLVRFTGAGGGDFYRTQTSRLGRRFPTALMASTLEGRTRYRDAFRLLGISKSETFDQLARELNFAV
jgi:Zn-dependent peptidase ImmA (M78 family)